MEIICLIPPRCLDQFGASKALPLHHIMQPVLLKASRPPCLSTEGFLVAVQGASNHSNLQNQKKGKLNGVRGRMQASYYCQCYSWISLGLITQTTTLQHRCKEYSQYAYDFIAKTSSKHIPQIPLTIATSELGS